MLDAAGIVVTETSTPIRAPDLAVVSDSMPAHAGNDRHEEAQEVRVGDEVRELVRAVALGEGADGDQHERGREQRQGCRSGSRPRVRSANGAPGCPGGGPMPRRCAASGPNSGPHHHGADDQDRLVEHDPDGGDLHRGDHEDDEADRQLRLLGGARLDLLPDDGVGGQAGRRLLGGAWRPWRSSCRSARRRSTRRSGTPRSLRSPMITLASSRATSHRIRSPSGLWATCAEADDVGHRGERRGVRASRLARSLGRRRSASGPSRGGYGSH